MEHPVIERMSASEPARKTECGSDCPGCIGGTCFLEKGHQGSHRCKSCGHTWETCHQARAAFEP